MEKKNTTTKVAPQMSSFEICIIMQFNPNTKEYVMHKYREKVCTEEEWKQLFKKDGLNF